MKAIVCGSAPRVNPPRRGWGTPGILLGREAPAWALEVEKALMWAVLSGLLVEVKSGRLEVAHGAAPGADACADQWAKSRRVPVYEYPASWTLHGRAAGPKRNLEMLERFDPDVVLAFKATAQSTGTDHMVRMARAAGKAVRVFHSPVADWADGSF